ncbi:SGNH/GDSL hydrolase family protein [Demequina lignilytica]|uniref:SGNH/GDSL hydrolase family protein n=1 Tax=Demequina lignilytica TaxID=3051663 RepID=A0AB35MK25_9MICO|nr:SGNH/GDSL hydrolase family protein [Demequina sp. SYSU T0a273]MDN4484160.1 SGNH/GDSL hydrolase family protein [Demequina sp. SYSU T0a273]
MRTVAAAGALAAMLVACAPADPGGATPGPSAASSPLRVAVVGDSLSFGDSSVFTQEGLGEGSYLFWALGDDALLAGGTAVPGATSLHQLERVTPVEADVLILALGTNDLAWGLPFEETASALVSIAGVVDAPRVLLLSIPPISDDYGLDTTAYNRQLRALAGEQGWEWVDAAAAIREGAAWAPGATDDGVHYTVEAARKVGEAVGKALRSGS